MSIPPPLLTRCWQELGRGMMSFHESLVLTEIQFPFLFVQVRVFVGGRKLSVF